MRISLLYGSPKHERLHIGNDDGVAIALDQARPTVHFYIGEVCNDVLFGAPVG
ncbi:hypothetical protein D3C81_926430 [compost metagenome]|nr:hypothetical protein LMG19282_01661 [Cupriavidus campinensis]